ncbi:MAG: hypothetical protein BGO04_05320 [Microbacterium sp. 70-38]|nr:MAG: hypothetical protein BGO04_05320 [Microbacterium sp. 70-38]
MRKAIVIPVAVVVGIFAISGIAAAINGPGSGSAPNSDEPAAAAQSDEPTRTPVMATVPNVVGKSGADAIAALELAHLKADTGSGDLTMPVTAQDVAAASQVEEGSVVRLTLQAKPVYTVAQESAIRSATSYLSLKGFSRAGLLEQLTSAYGEGFAPADAEFAVAEIEKAHQVDWNEEAVESAKSYLELKGFSRQGLFEQLTSAYGEQFTAAQANYALDKVGLR